MLCLSGNGEEELEFGRKLVLGVETIGEVNSSDSAVRMNLNSQRLDVVCAVSASSEVRQVELNLVPSLVQSHGHCADEGLHSCRRLVIRCAESPADVLVVEDLDLEGEVFLEVLDDHDEERQLDAEGLVGISRAGDVVRGDIGSHDFEDTRLDVGVSDTLDVAIADALVPNLKGLGTNRVQDGQEARLEGVFKHLYSSVIEII